MAVVDLASKWNTYVDISLRGGRGAGGYMPPHLGKNGGSIWANETVKKIIYVLFGDQNSGSLVQNSKFWQK